MHGESAVSGTPHGDNVLPALFGGFVLGRSAHPMDHVRIQGWQGLYLAIILPDIQVLTRAAREILPASISLTNAVDHAARLGLLVDALHRQDARRLAVLSMSDTLIEPLRAAMIPVYDSIKKAALKTGALGCTLSGSGPAMIAFSDDPARLTSIRRAMETACRSMGIECLTVSDQVNNQGARVVKT
jgi:homoserine kinase